MATVSRAASSWRHRHHEVHLLQDLALGGRVLAALGGDAPHRDARHMGEPVADAETGRAGLPVDENGGGPLAGGARAQGSGHRELPFGR
jgi:hypothetical protein